MRILLCGEGPHDVGVPDSWDTTRGEYVSLDGWLQPMVCQALAAIPEFFVRRRGELQVQGRQRLRGHGAKAYLAKRLALTSGYDVLIYMADADSKDVREWHRHVGDIEAGFARLDADAVRCIACVPMSASESWLLSDADAWAAVADAAVVGLPRRPEAIWGARDDPAGNHPRRLFWRICDSAGLQDDRQTRNLIAQAMSLTTGRSKCPQSMDPFLVALGA